MAIKRQSKVRQAYMKQRKRLMAFQKSAEKRGYIFEQPLVPTQIPSRITQRMVKELEYLTPARIYAKNTTQYVDAVSGVIIPGRVARQIEYSKRNLSRQNLDNFTKRRNQYLHDYGIDMADFSEIPNALRQQMDDAYNATYKKSFTMFPQYEFGEFTQEFDESRYKNLVQERPISPDDDTFIDEYINKDGSPRIKDLDAKALNAFNAFMQDMKEFPLAFWNKLVSYINPIIDKVGKQEFGRALDDMKAEGVTIYDMLVSTFDSGDAFEQFSSSVIQHIPFLDDEQKTALETIMDEESWGE